RVAPSLHAGPPMSPSSRSPRVQELLAEHLRRIHVETDRLFAGLIIFQWVAALALAQWLSPRAWDGVQSSIHLHVYLALFLGGALTLVPVLLARTRPGEVGTRHTIAVAQALWSA